MLAPIRSVLVLLAGAWLTALCKADVFVVAAADAPLQTISTRELQALYMGKRQGLTDGLRIQATDLPRDHPLRERFYGQLTGLSAAQVSSHWARLLFSGQSTPPFTLNDEAAMLGYLQRTPRALGYSAVPPPAQSGLKVLLVLKSPNNPDTVQHAP